MNYNYQYVRIAAAKTAEEATWSQVAPL